MQLKVSGGLKYPDSVRPLEDLSQLYVLGCFDSVIILGCFSSLRPNGAKDL